MKNLVPPLPWLLALAMALSLSCVEVAAHDLQLPIEVLGNGSPAAPIISEVTLALPAGAQGQAVELWFRCHRCGFYGAPEFEAVTAAPPVTPASIRILGGLTDATQVAAVKWTNITDATVQLADPERLAGGVNGGAYTIRATLKLDDATRARLVGLPSLNRVQFRFNGTDGESNGYRILDLQLRNAGHADIGANTVKEADPLVEHQSGSAYTADTDKGQALWYAKDTLTKNSIVARTIHAACSSCHEESGRDLQYFNYSDKAIIQRARFHGLSEDKGRLIAAYIRYAQRDVPYAAGARPWNPPYQPGPGLDAKSISQWAAGAGVDAVLDSPAQAVSALFGKTGQAATALTQADIDRVMDPAATMNAREIPVALQFPDWNAWLPAIHPDDVWPSVGGVPEGSFEDGAKFASSTVLLDPVGKWTDVHDWLEANKGTVAGSWTHLTPVARGTVQDKLYQMGWEAYRFLGGVRGDHINHGSGGRFGTEAGAALLKSLADPAKLAANPGGAFSTAAFMERATSSMMQWEAVKQWELVQKYGLEGDQTQLVGKYANGAWTGQGESRGWNFNTPGLFYLAPHMLYQLETVGGQVRQWYFAWETGQLSASYYRTNQWYQLQMVVNSGARAKFSNYPMDWPYLLRFDEMLAEQVWEDSAAGQAAATANYVRLLQGRIKAAQHVNNDIVLYDPTQPDLLLNAGFTGRAEAAKHLALSNFVDQGAAASNSTPLRLLDTLAPGLYVKVVNGAITQYTKLYAGTDPAKWRRCDPTNTRLGSSELYAGFAFCLDAGRTPLQLDKNGAPYVTDGATSLYQANVFGYAKAVELGADPTRLQVFKQWNDRAWPAK